MERRYERLIWWWQKGMTVEEIATREKLDKGRAYRLLHEARFEFWLEYPSGWIRYGEKRANGTHALVSRLADEHRMFMDWESRSCETLTGPVTPWLIETKLETESREERREHLVAEANWLRYQHEHTERDYFYRA